MSERCVISTVLRSLASGTLLFWGLVSIFDIHNYNIVSSHSFFIYEYSQSSRNCGRSSSVSLVSTIGFKRLPSFKRFLTGLLIFGTTASFLLSSAELSVLVSETTGISWQSSDCREAVGFSKSSSDKIQKNKKR